ncbi:MAG: stage II sporulation protein P [bacterium]|nr:stage II sporulation protein P [bacterium]
MPLKLRLIGGLVAILGVVLLGALWHAEPDRFGAIPRFASYEGREESHGFHTLYGPDRQVLLETAHPFSTGDLFVGDGDRRYEVVRVWGRRAHARELRPDGDGAPALATPYQAIPLGAARPLAVVYHSHSDEAYYPTDGAAFIPGKGSILEVGRILAASLERESFVAIHDRTRHDPHDALAYLRSSRTVVANLTYRPQVLFDVHRDAVPAKAYRTRIDGQVVARVLLVVGRQNPLRAANLRLAKRLKAVGDEIYPGLIKGVFVARGNYNQHLDPGLLLLEIGTAYQPREEADGAAMLMGEVISRALGPAR